MFSFNIYILKYWYFYNWYLQIGLIMFFVPQLLVIFGFSPSPDVCTILVPHVLYCMELVLNFKLR